MRRIVDFIVALATLVVLGPVLLAIALAVAIDSPGSPFYLAWRVGKDGRNFRMWKFRTMVRGADAMGSVTGRNDPRVTRLGRLLRRSKVDELPQFLNVLLGHMTLIGPRPETPDMVARYTPEQRSVLLVKPGITGRVQLDYGDESEQIPEGERPDEYYVRCLMGKKVNQDIEYLNNRTTWTDTRILLRTAAFVLRSVVRP